MVLVASVLIGFCRFLVEVVYRRARGWCICSSVLIGLQFEFVASILLPLLLSIVPLLLPSGDGGEMEVFEEYNPVLAVPSSLWLFVLLFNNSKDLGEVPGNLRFLDSTMWGSKDPIDGSVPVLQFEICCPIT